MARSRKSSPTPKSAQSYQHPDSDLPARPEIGAQAHFKQAKPPTKYRFDSSLAPALEWDGQNPSRERAEALIGEIAESGLKLADLAKKEASKERERQIEKLRAKIRDGESSLRKISGPFLDWAGKAERLSFDVPTLPLFVHERLSTSAILDTLKGHNTHWKPGVKTGGMERLAKANRLMLVGNTLRYKRYVSDYPVYLIDNVWDDTAISGFGRKKEYVVETSTKVIERCLLMTTNPGDLVLDPTCGSGTTAFVAEQWGRRWITCDTSRVPLALARQRLLTATYDYFELNDETHGPAGGFVYKRKQNQKGEEVGGIIPHITLGSIANNEPPAEEVLVDRPEIVRNVVRVTGPFTFEATIPTAQGLEGKTETPSVQAEEQEKYVQRMLEVLRRAPVLRLPGNQTVTLKNIRPPAKTLTLDAEALVDKPTLANLADDVSKQPSLTRESEAVAIVFGPENGPLTERLVREAWDEAGLKHYTHLYVIGFAIDPKARQFIDSAGKIGVACTYLQATMDLQMGDLLKNMRSSQIFSVCGLPDVKITRMKPDKSVKKDVGEQWEVELLGLDTFDPITMDADHLKPGEVPAWLLDTDYNGMVFRVRQAFFPRTGAWENLKKSLKVEFEDTVWDHLAGTTSAPFPAGEHKQIAVKVIDPRGNELLVVRKLEETK
jgi:adenine-specific DNA-methyltransferase